LHISDNLILVVVPAADMVNHVDRLGYSTHNVMVLCDFLLLVHLHSCRRTCFIHDTIHCLSLKQFFLILLQVYVRLVHSTLGDISVIYDITNLCPIQEDST
jgi:hypothetical protein